MGPEEVAFSSREEEDPGDRKAVYKERTALFTHCHIMSSYFVVDTVRPQR